MAIKSRVKETTNNNFSKRIGIGEFEVVAVNPSREELNEMFSFNPEENKEEIVYVKEKEIELEDGDTITVEGAKISFYLKDVKSGNVLLTPLSFYLENRERSNKDN